MTSNNHKYNIIVFLLLQILELTLLIADYMNALGRGSGTPLAGTLTRTTQPDILKATPDHQLHRTDSHKRNDT